MKIILFLVNTHKDKYQLFVKAGRKLGIEVQIHTYQEISIYFQEQNPSQPLLKIAGQNLTDFSLIYLRTLIKSPELQMLISQSCKENNIPIMDPVFSYQEPFIDGKAFTYFKLVKHGLPIIDTLMIINQNKTQIEQLKFPLIAKASSGSQGRDVYLCQNKEELTTIVNKYSQPLLIEPFIKNDGDIRLTIIGDRFIAAIKRTSQKDEFRNNTSLGGKAVAYQPSKTEIKIAIQATQVMNYVIAGVDLIYDQSLKKWLIMEVNRAPQFTTLAPISGIDIPLEIIKYFKELIRKNIK